ncbi:hypothetical protein BD560DRAFT_424173 [Blakeslea trispora]|nr:hypothetical protein BD560DRAFT_424173 [Blakeslea trispora]
MKWFKDTLCGLSHKSQASVSSFELLFIHPFKEDFVLIWLYALILIVFFIDLIPWILSRYRCLSSVVSMVFTCTSGNISARFCQCFNLPCHLFLPNILPISVIVACHFF